MADEDLFTASAGWYPDPLGLPQLRWWNSHAWTEQVSSPHQPVVMQDAKFAWADDELPTRREERERERQESGERAPIDTSLPASDGLGELDPPTATEPVDPVPAETAARSFDALFGAAAMSRTAGISLPGATPEPAATPVPTTRITSSTGPGWIIALIPLFQLVLAMLAVVALGVNGDPLVVLGILAVPYVVVVPLAYFDRRALLAGGNVRPAHWLWSLLTAPVYLVLRARATIRESGQGIGPVLVWFGLAVLQVVSVIAVPGLLISALPTVFAGQAASSIEAQAASISGSEITVDCDGHPPVILGQVMTCEAVSADGTRSDVMVELTRANGWISWPVVDWGGITDSR